MSDKIPTLAELRKEIEDTFKSKGYTIVGAQEKDTDYIIYLKVPKRRIKK